ncbi:phosphoenolpyruvate synthase [Actinomycetospora termitidis]|uniref:Phosphoenolpyruvate synthase n=1 Tax=Actinomycetospora termitidis TaxID=3053470 RepID=A0ABT7MC54_9PSEU|nr:phosphoenolpyruvate synthase [Actinomycetospora sp. Odt1-22]MDL5158251.1 phosphoenolpyruvate synthase [Actinomycetospora sp. Odt1-22]
MGTDVLDLREIDRSRAAEVGGKAANLGELARVPGIAVPAGSCVTTEAFRRVLAGVPSLADRLEQLNRPKPDDQRAIAELSAAVREAIVAAPVPGEIAEAVVAVTGGGPYAVRSSATAEDLPAASFAGQQDTYLDVPGPEVLEHVRRCWASLFTDRAVTYRLRQGIDHRTVLMAVVVQEMVAAEASGVLFTADPVTSHRRVAAVEAVPGLGEALVSGVTNPDRWTVRDGVVEGAVVTAPGVLTEARVLELVALGRRIEAHFGCPQDIEWCLADGGFAVVQSRPITTLFPVPATDDDDLHVYISTGHQQMMTDAMTPLGLSVWQMTTPRPMAEAGSRLFVDVTGALTSSGRQALLDMWGRGDPLVRDALETVLARDELRPTSDDRRGTPPPAPEMIDADPALVAELIAAAEASVAGTARAIRSHHGEDLFAFVAEDFVELRRLLFDPRSHQVFMTAMDAALWLDEHVGEWLGEGDVSDTLTLSVPDNVTSQMGMALLDVADVIRPRPAVVAFLRGLSEDDSLDGLLDVEGGAEAHEALHGFLDTYGMRCIGEIDISRPRWAERPAALVPIVLGHVDHAAPGDGRRRFDAGREQADRKGAEILERLRALPDGERKAAETRAMIDRLRTFIGYREFPKFAMIQRYFLYKQALLDEAGRLVDDGVLDAVDDMALLRFDELREVVRTRQVDRGLLDERRQALAVDRTLTPPRVLTSDGEALSGTYRRDDLPDGALAGLPVSRGVVEGRARVVLDIADAAFESGDILVTAFTDPSWSPAFVAVVGLVTEVGGTMTHGAVVAREYGLPAVVGVERATQRIPDGQRIRVDGTSGSVEFLPSSAPP